MRHATILLTVLLMASACSVQALAAARDAFAGTWKGVVTPDEDAMKKGQKEVKDTFTFKGDQFTSAAFEKHGFTSMQYSEDTRAGIASMATFKAEGKSEKNGTAVWTGTANAGEMTGELTWTKADGTELKFSFKATRQ